MGDIPITLMHTPRTFLKVSAEQMKAMLEQLQQKRPQNEPAKPQRFQQRATDNTPESSVRVRMDRLDRLVDMVGELVIAQSSAADLDFTCRCFSTAVCFRWGGPDRDDAAFQVLISISK